MDVVLRTNRHLCGTIVTYPLCGEGEKERGREKEKERRRGREKEMERGRERGREGEREKSWCR